MLPWSPRAVYGRELMAAPPQQAVETTIAAAAIDKRQLLPATETDGGRRSSRFCGVYWHKQRNKWAAKIMHGGRRRYLGCFIDEVDAALAYDREKRTLLGPEAKLNFPSRSERKVAKRSERKSRPSSPCPHRSPPPKKAKHQSHHRMVKTSALGLPVGALASSSSTHRWHYDDYSRITTEPPHQESELSKREWAARAIATPPI